jgi:hypothetical protein
MTYFWSFTILYGHYLESVHKLRFPACSPFGKGGWRGILRIYAYFIVHKISPCPSFPKRGIMELAQKTIYKQTLEALAKV